jgi:hypothetical protein
MPTQVGTRIPFAILILVGFREQDITGVAYLIKNPIEVGEYVNERNRLTLVRQLL